MSARPLELGLYTDSLKHLGFEAALDVAAEIGATGIEIATGGQSSAPHLRIDELTGDEASARRRPRQAGMAGGDPIVSMTRSGSARTWRIVSA